MNAEPPGGFAWTPGFLPVCPLPHSSFCKEEEPMCVALRFKEDGGE